METDTGIFIHHSLATWREEHKREQHCQLDNLPSPQSSLVGGILYLLSHQNSLVGGILYRLSPQNSQVGGVLYLLSPQNSQVGGIIYLLSPQSSQVGGILYRLTVFIPRRLDRRAPNSVCRLLKLLAVVLWIQFPPPVPPPPPPPRVVVIRRGRVTEICRSPTQFLWPDLF